MPTLIIIGAGTGVSAAIARRFGREGYSVGLIARSPSSLDRLCEGLEDEGITASAEPADAGDLPGLSEALARLAGRLGGCDVLVWNASVQRPGGPLDTPVETVQRELSVNLLGALQSVQQVAPAMVEAGTGAILFTGGGLALEPFPEWTSLALGKAALRSLGLSLYKELAPKGVHVSVVAICGHVAPGTAFDPDTIAQEYYRLATAPKGVKDRELILQPQGSDVYYNDPKRRHAMTTLPPAHVRLGR
ncbi:SDR family oxidoreductase [Pararhodobacter marinus]|uniref:SDR family oxidoreductase n=1 Tax=Pararhodobacter marinus TaxID=2184063 RepID=UPI00143DE45A|nr:SDR family NAD(P)-dependent oxidoreductase [Pararhodobacter marinus]